MTAVPAGIDVDVRLERGSFALDARFAPELGLTALLGRSGTGKTSIVLAIAGLLKPVRGHIRVDGVELYNAASGINLPPEQRRVGYVFQDSRLFPHMRVSSNLQYGMKLLPKTERRHTIDEVTSILGIADLLDRFPASLSGGEKQRVAIGRALLASPRILLMDEPLASLDADRKEEIFPFIERLRDEIGIPIVYVSHSVEEVVRLADTMVVLAEGRTLAEGDVEDIMSRLDLRPHTGRYEAGAVINVWVLAHDERHALTELSFGAGSIWVPKLEAPKNTPLRLRLRARDVSLSLKRPEQSATMNTFEGTIVDIEEAPPRTSPHADILVNIGAPIIARIARKAITELDLAKGMHVFVSVKSSAIDRQSMGLGRRRET